MKPLKIILKFVWIQNSHVCLGRKWWSVNLSVSYTNGGGVSENAINHLTYN